MKKRGRKVILEWMEQCVEGGCYKNYSHLHIDFIESNIQKRKINDPILNGSFLFYWCDKYRSWRNWSFKQLLKKFLHRMISVWIRTFSSWSKEFMKIHKDRNGYYGKA